MIPASTLALLPAAIPSPPESFARFSIGPLTIHAYALCILLGIVAALWLTLRRWKARGGQSDVVWDVAIWAIPFGIIGGRLYHVFSSPDAYFGPNYDGTGDPIKILYIWNGGLGIWGAVALGAVGAWIGTRRAGVRLSAFADAAAPGVLLAQAIGRWGNWFNQELFGSATTLPWGLKIDASSPNFPAGYPADTLFHPTFLYESLWNFAGVALLLMLDRRFKLRFGSCVWLYVVIYTAGRTWIEAMRIDEAQMITISGITARLNVWTSLIMFVIALLIFILCLIRSRTAKGDFMYLPGHEPADRAEVLASLGERVPESESAVSVGGRASAADATDAQAAERQAKPSGRRAAGADAPVEASPAPAVAAPAVGAVAAHDEDSPYPTAADVADEAPAAAAGPVPAGAEPASSATLGASHRAEVADPAPEAAVEPADAAVVAEPVEPAETVDATVAVEPTEAVAADDGASEPASEAEAEAETAADAEAPAADSGSEPTEPTDPRA